MPEQDDILPAQIVWLDPGKMSGYAYYTSSHTFHSGQLEFQPLGEQLELTCSINEQSLWLGWEDFLINPLTASRKGSEFALEVIGMSRYLAQKYGCTILQPCPPSGRELGSLIKLKRLGWYKTGNPHANDAASHLLAHGIRDHWLPSDLLKKAMDVSAVA
jgi:hypothetical protein